VAIAPLAIRPPQLMRLAPWRTVEFLGTGSVGSDYLDVIVRRGFEHRAERALTEYLNRESLVLELKQLHKTGSTAAKLAQRLREEHWSLQESVTNVCPLIKLSGHSWESYLGTLGRDHRYNFRRRLKNLQQQFDMRFEMVRTEEERNEALPLLIRLHQLRWDERGGSDALHEPDLQAFHETFSRSALKRKWLRLFVLRLNDVPAASIYAFRYGPSFYFYQSGFDPRFSKNSVGLVIMGLVIKHAVEEGAEEYDLLHGDESYKSHWASERRELIRLELYPPRARGWLCQRTVEFSRAAKTFARRILPRPFADQLAAGLVKGGP
jgi:CelD/BcsL family acetyltransferase involved in cellulose biosynthesis